MSVVYRYGKPGENQMLLENNVEPQSNRTVFIPSSGTSPESTHELDVLFCGNTSDKKSSDNSSSAVPQLTCNLTKRTKRTKATWKIKINLRSPSLHSRLRREGLTLSEEYPPRMIDNHHQHASPIYRVWYLQGNWLMIS